MPYGIRKQPGQWPGCLISGIAELLLGCADDIAQLHVESLGLLEKLLAKAVEISLLAALDLCAYLVHKVIVEIHSLVEEIAESHVRSLWIYGCNCVAVLDKCVENIHDVLLDVSEIHISYLLERCKYRNFSGKSFTEIIWTSVHADDALSGVDMTDDAACAKGFAAGVIWRVRFNRADPYLL